MNGCKTEITEKTTERGKTKSISQTTKSNLFKPTFSIFDQTAFLQRNLGNQAFQRSYHSGLIQPMLKMKEPGDEYEQETDRVADDVMRMTDEEALHLSQSGLRIQRKCSGCASGGGACPECADKEEVVIQAKNMTGQTPTTYPFSENQLDSMKVGGQQLPEHTRAFFESRFGADFRHVRVHTDYQAGETAKGINARAFTIGRDITFGAGEYSPDTVQGKCLLAHELTHVVQQGGVGSDIIRRQVFLPEGEPEEPTPEEPSDEHLFEELDFGLALLDTGDEYPYVWFELGSAELNKDKKFHARENLEKNKASLQDRLTRVENPEEWLIYVYGYRSEETGEGGWRTAWDRATIVADALNTRLAPLISPGQI